MNGGARDLDQDYYAGMTLAEAVEVLRAEPWGCACVGGPWCCRFRRARVEQLHRAAHIVARLVDDHARSAQPNRERHTR